MLLLLVCAGCQHPAKRAAAPRAAPNGSMALDTPRRLPPTVPASERQWPVVPASYEADEPTLETLPAPISQPPPERAAGALSLDDVVRSVHSSFPLLEVEISQRQVADGEAISAWGPYDLNLEAYGITAPEGYYKNYRNGVALKQAVYTGGYVYGGYRIGRDDIQPWYKERLTDKGGEFKVGLGVPLLQDRRIDKYRSEVLQTSLAREAVEPGIQAQLLQFVLAASDAYWTWVAAGQALKAQEEMLRLATARVEQIEERVRSGDLEQIARIDNQRLIASRETKLIEAQRKFQAAAIKLSLFLRDESGMPQVAPVEWLPPAFPELSQLDADQVENDVALAQTMRPELQVLDLLSQQVHVELAAAENKLLPKLDARLEASKDVGQKADEKGDKTPFELEAGLWGELPLQRREAYGKIHSLQGKIAQILAKRQYTADKVAAEVRDAVSALVAAAERIERARVTVQLAEQSLDLGRQAFEAGDLTVVTLNIYEQAVMDARVQQIEAEADYFKALAAYHAAVGASPLSESNHAADAGGDGTGA